LDPYFYDHSTYLQYSYQYLDIVTELAFSHPSQFLFALKGLSFKVGFKERLQLAEKWSMIENPFDRLRFVQNVFDHVMGPPLQKSVWLFAQQGSKDFERMKRKRSVQEQLYMATLKDPTAEVPAEVPEKRPKNTLCIHLGKP